MSKIQDLINRAIEYFSLLIKYLDSLFIDQQTTIGGSMDIIAVLQQLAVTITELQLKLADAQAATEEIKTVFLEQGRVLGLEEGKAIGYADGYAVGFEAGKLEGGGKIYTQEELDQAVASAVGPLNERIAAIEVELQAVKDSIPQAIADGVSAFKVELKVKLDELLAVAV